MILYKVPDFIFCMIVYIDTYILRAYTRVIAVFTKGKPVIITPVNNAAIILLLHLLLISPSYFKQKITQTTCILHYSDSGVKIFDYLIHNHKILSVIWVMFTYTYLNLTVYTSKGLSFRLTAFTFFP